MKTRVERWALAPGEEGPKCKSQDELIATGCAERGIIVYRNGEVSNRYDDGTVGISHDESEAAGAEDTLWHPDANAATNAWRNVNVNTTPGPDYGAFVSFAGYSK